VPDRCLDCNAPPLPGPAPRAETFAVRGPSGAAIHLTLRLCAQCASRYPGRSELRDYLRGKLPDYAARWVLATAKR